MKITLRKANENDVNPVRFLFRDTVIAINSRDYTKEEIQVWSDHHQSNLLWSKKLSEQYFIVAELNNQLIGFGSINNTGYLDFLYVHKDFQGQGIAGKLVEELEKRAELAGIKEIYSHVSKTARSFFEGKGFTKTGNHINRVNNIEFVNSIMVKKIVR